MLLYLQVLFICIFWIVSPKPQFYHCDSLMFHTQCWGICRSWLYKSLTLVSPKPKILSYYKSQVSHTMLLYLQVLIIEVVGIAFSTTGLTIDQWLWCLFFGVGELLWGQVCVHLHPVKKFHAFLSQVSGYQGSHILEKPWKSLKKIGTFSRPWKSLNLVKIE